MPVRSSSSSVLRWPDAEGVRRAVEAWARQAAIRRPEVLRIGYFGSYARGDWGVGSDLDLLIIVDQTDLPFERRAAAWDSTELPVPTDTLVYTGGEWDRLRREDGMAGSLERETVWVYERGSPPAASVGQPASSA